MVILVTGTLVPQAGVFALQLTDREKRIAEYVESLRKLRSLKVADKVVFCENSGDPQAADHVKKQLEGWKNLEILSFNGNTEKVMQYGKGYGEGEIIEYALKNSRFLKGESEFVKLTGRIEVKNLDTILSKMKPGLLYFDPVKIFGKDKQIDTKLYKLSKKVYEEHFLKLYTQVRDQDGIFIEHLFWSCLKESGLAFQNMPEYPRFQGKSGSVGVSYGTTEWKYQIKNILCKLKLYKNQ